ncbi:hypothetical protein N752_25135 [Desulforamulus aquiferis]|nr:hypothetical protein [Desulforamulus aquiferis]RYD02615.1 hypothetical protein N752_25135 [Desulforamulus aquiferis]
MINQFLKEGLSSLRTKSKSGRPRKIDTLVESQIKLDLQRRPADLGYAHPYWTRSLVSEHVEKIYNLKINKAKAFRLINSTDNAIRKKRKISIKQKLLERKLFINTINEANQDEALELWYLHVIPLGCLRVGKKECCVCYRPKDHFLLCAIEDKDNKMYFRATYEFTQNDYQDFVHEVIENHVQAPKAILVMKNKKRERTVLESLSNTYKGHVNVLFTPDNNKGYEDIQMFKLMNQLEKVIKDWIQKNKLSVRHSRKEIRQKAESIIQEMIKSQPQNF